MEEFIEYYSGIFVRVSVTNYSNYLGFSWIVSDTKDHTGTVTAMDATQYNLREAVGHFLEYKEQQRRNANTERK
jgi:hypothetical protein